MSLFGSTAPTPQEVSRENIVKASITENLKQTIKALQKQHVNSEEPIYSEDTANAVCNILEAVFIHGLKASLSKKIPMLSLVSGEANKNPLLHPTFWGFLTKVTHSDVISQLNHLGQITTETGMCRAWIRMAINDSVLESYLHSILSDTKTLSKSYKRTAYLRDSEQTAILTSLVQGISTLRFQLSYNSSLLNVWTRTPLVLAGMAQPTDFPRPFINSNDHAITVLSGSEPLTEEAQEATALSSTPPSSLISSTAPSPTAPSPNLLKRPENKENLVATKTRRKKKHKSRTVVVIGNQDTGLPAQPQNTPLDPSLLSNTDIEDIRQLTAMLKEEGSGGSTAGSQISHPDSYDARESQRIPPGVSRCSQTPDKSLHSVDGSCQGAVLKTENTTPKTSPKRAKKSEQKGNLESGKSVISEHSETEPAKSPKTGIKHLFPSLGGASGSDPRSTEPKDNHEGASVDVDSANKVDINSHDLVSDLGSSTSESLSIPEKPQQGESSREPSPKRAIPVPLTLSHSSSDSHLRRSLAHQRESDNGVAGRTRVPRAPSMPQFSPLGKTPPVAPELTMVTAVGTQVEVALDATGEHQSEGIIMDFGEEEPSPQGNSLGQFQGWSSDFDPPVAPDLGANTTGEPDLSTPQGMATHIARLQQSTNDSFTGLLRSYGPTAGQIETPSMFAVLQTLDDPEQTSSEASSTLEERQKCVPKKDSLDSLYSDYEILPDPTGEKSVLEDQTLQPLLELIGKLCTEKGLDMQNNQCKTCSRPIGMFYGKARVCYFDGAYYCYECHENEEYYIPAKIVYNWDFGMYKVSKKNMEFLRQVEDEPLIHLQKLNPRLYDHISEMNNVKLLRTQLRFLKAYLFTCKQSVADEFRRQLWPKEYYYEDIHLYSLMDFFQVPSGQLAATLKKVIKFATSHVYDCRLCSQKGFICEICRSSKAIYPFEMDSTARCETCRSVYHKACKTELVPCPKCDRRRQRLSLSGMEHTSLDTNEDYAINPGHSHITVS